MKYVYAIVAVVLMAGAASAGPVLLGSFDRYGGSGSTGITDPRVQLGINVLSINDLPDSVSLDMILFSDSFLEDGGSGTFEFDRDNSVLFSEFADLLTNGVDDRVGLLSIWSGFGHVGIQGHFESFFFDRDIPAGEVPDFVGYELDFIRLVIRSVDIEPVTIQGLDGYLAIFDYTYEFHGTPIPEPGTLLLLVSGGMLNLIGRHMR